MKRCTAVLALLMLSAAALSLLYPADARQDRLARLINLGKAFYENPATPKEAAEQFRQALALDPKSAREHLNYGLALLRAGRTPEGVAELEKARAIDPSLPHPYFNLGVAFKREGDFARAFEQFSRVAKLAPEEPVTHYNLGTLYRLRGESGPAIAEFQTAARLDPTLAAPHFQLFNIYRMAKQAGQAQKELAIFQEIKKRQAATGSSEDMDWSYYSEILDNLHAGGAADGATPVEVVFQDQRVGSVGSAAGAGLAALDADGDGKLDLLAWSAERVVLFHNTGRGFSAEPVEGARGPVAVADFNNDGLPDLCVLGSGGAQLWINRQGSFARPAKPLHAGAFRQALAVDYDHDYDLDLLLLGSSSVLLRNNGDGAWTDVSSAFPFVKGDAEGTAVLELGENTNTFDIVVAYRDRSAVLYRDRKVGRYEAAPLPFSLAGALAVGDFNQDGYLDLAAIGSGGVTFVENRRGTLERGPQLADTSAALFADFQNRGRTDLLAGPSLLLHKSGFAYQAGQVRGAPASFVAATAGDFDNDGLTDAAIIAPDGSVHLLRNATPSKNAWLKVALTGIKNLKLASGARVEVKAGALYQKQVYQGAPLLFGLAGYQQADTVRITWPNGLVQNEPRQAVAANYRYKEEQRLSGSCPMIYTWNGDRFEFITDVLGTAPLGAGLADGRFFPVADHEYVQVPGRSLQPRNGLYEVRVAEELREVSYLDQIQLIAVDHRVGEEIFTNEKFKSPPFPDFRLYGVARRIYPTRAVDDQGRDVLDRVLRRDRRYPDGFRRDLNGRAELHSLTLDFPAAPAPRPGSDPSVASARASTGDAQPAAAAPAASVLFLHGWVDWADGSTFVAASQSRGGALVAPYLQVKDAAGHWVTAIEDMGMPAGKPKTIAVDLTGKFRSASREVRIVTNMCVYWDEIFLGANTRPPQVKLTPLAPQSADLHFRGFSAVRIDPQRRLPEYFEYPQVRPVSMWNPTPGHYTRYGDVRELLQAVDDRFVIMGSGDELELRFAASALPPLPAGWARDFLLRVDGWAKDADANTAFGGSVEPLPFHAMRSYPYGPGEHYPDDAAHQQYRRDYNTRPALRLIRPLVTRK